MEVKTTKYDRIRSLPWLYIFTFWNVAFVLLSFWGPIFPLFMRECGLSIRQIGLISSTIPVMGIFSFFISDYIRRIGAKKTAIFALLLRTMTFAFVTPIPLFITKLTPDMVFIWLFFVTIIFACFRVISDTSYAEWMGELIPNERRGKTDGISTIVTGIAGTLVAGCVALLSKVEVGKVLFALIFFIATITGLISVATLIRLPCGEPKQLAQSQDKNLFINIYNTLKNKNFVLFLIANNVTWIYWTGLVTFLPIFLREQIKFSQSNVFLMEMWMRLASVFTCFLWGWCADRFGSKPVMMTGLYGSAIIPIAFILYPFFPSEWLIYIFSCIYVVIGIVLYAFVLGANRYFYVGAVPKGTNRVYFVTINFTLQSVAMTIAPIISGTIIGSFHGLNKKIYGLEISQYTPFFIVMIFTVIIAILAGRKLIIDGPIDTTGRFISLFVEGNPFSAFSNIMRFHYSLDEEERMIATKQIGDAGTRLGISDLLTALNDPSFNVRYEAVLALSNMPFDNQVLEALKKVLYSEEPDLSELAGWILGRYGDKRAIEPLRYMLRNARYALLRARCARSLANLGDTGSIEEILRQFRQEKHISIKVAYAAALGKLRVTQVFGEIESLLAGLNDISLQGEAALAIARMLGTEKHFVRLWRILSVEDISVGLAGYISDLNQKYKDSSFTQTIKPSLEKLSDLFAIGDSKGAVTTLIDTAKLIMQRSNVNNDVLKKIMERSIFVLTDKEELRKDYLILLITSLEHIIVHHIKSEKEKEGK